MDSLTQIVLGAAVGEVVLGKKVGNRAMFWGAVAGTIPDLDIFANFATDDMGSLAFHRAITHSVPFAIIVPFMLGWLVYHVYDRTSPPVNASMRLRGIDFFAGFKKCLLVGLGVIALVAFGASVQPISLGDALKIGTAVGASIMLVPFLVLFWQKIRRPKDDQPKPSVKEWTWLFFWAIFTHPLLDCCTSYGTQLFQPFWDYRVAFNNISVADPIYTIPFLLCLILASFFSRHRPIRRIINYMGIGISSLYLLFTFYNKFKVEAIFERSLQSQNIDYERFILTPSIFNNILWQGVAEGDTAYYHGMYSLLDEEPRILNFVTIPKNHEWIAAYENERDIQILRWFSNDYYSILKRKDGQLQLNDLRFGSINNQSFHQEDDFVFKFVLEEKDGRIIAHSVREEPDNASQLLNDLWTRIKGIKNSSQALGD